MIYTKRNLIRNEAMNIKTYFLLFFFNGNVIRLFHIII